MTDYGSRDTTFIQAIRDVRQGIIKIAEVDGSQWSAVLMQGCGTMGVEATIGTTTRRSGAKFLVLRNGSYSDRMFAVCQRLAIPTLSYGVPEGKDFDLQELSKILEANPDITNVGMIHSETSTGALNPITEVYALVKRIRPDVTMIVDAMSSFGGVVFDVEKSCDALVTSSNKCVQGVPGFSIVVIRKPLLARCKGLARSFTLDVFSQGEGLDKNLQFNQTPPVHAIMAFRQALIEHRKEGGTAVRQARYKAICKTVLDGMTKLGFRPFLDTSKPTFGHIITAYHSPVHPKWDFQKFYELLRVEGFVIYPGKASKADTFRIGSIGDLTVRDAKDLLACIRRTLKKMGVDLKQKSKL